MHNVELPTFFSNDSGRTPIFLAAQYGNFSTLELLLERPTASDCINKMDDKKVS